MSDALRRASRTFLQAFLGTLIASGGFSAAQSEGVVDWSALTKVGISATVAGIIALVSWAQNALEDKTGQSIAVRK